MRHLLVSGSRLLVLLVVLLLPAPLLVVYQVSGFTTTQNVPLIVASALSLAVCFLLFRVKWRFSFLTTAVGVVGVWMFLSLAWATAPPSFLVPRVIALAVRFLLMGVVAAFIYWHPMQGVKFLLASLVWVGPWLVFLLLWGIVKAVGWADMPGALLSYAADPTGDTLLQNWLLLRKATFFSSGTRYVGHWAMYSFIVAFGMIIGKRQDRPLPGWAILLGLVTSFAALAFTRSRSAMVAGIVGAGLLIWRRRGQILFRRHSPLVILLVAGVVAVLLLVNPAGIANLFLGRFLTKTELGALSHRDVLWGLGVDQVLSAPLLGLGLGGGEYLLDSGGFVENNFHNIYMGFAVDFGLIILPVFAWITLAVPFRLWRHARFLRHFDLQAANGFNLLTAASLGFLVTSLINVSYNVPDLWFFIGIAVGLSRVRVANLVGVVSKREPVTVRRQFVDVPQPTSKR